MKTLDAAGSSHISTDHTDRQRLTAHAAITRHTARLEYGTLPDRMRLVVIAVSTFGAIGGPGRAFLTELGRRVGTSLPTTLLDCATWAVPQLAPFARMALGFAVRRGLAESIYRHWVRVADPADVLRAQPAAPAGPAAPVQFVPVAAPPVAPGQPAAPVVAPVAVVPVVAAPAQGGGPQGQVAAQLFGGAGA